MDHNDHMSPQERLRFILFLDGEIKAARMTQREAAIAAGVDPSTVGLGQESDSGEESSDQGESPGPQSESDDSDDDVSIIDTNVPEASGTKSESDSESENSDEILARKNFAKSGNPESESDSEDDYKTVITGDELWLKPIEENLEKRIYSRETLLSLIPEKPEFDELRERLRIQKTVYRYSTEMSNNIYQKRYWLEHFKRVPSDIPKVRVVLRGDDLAPFYGKDRPFVGRNPPFGGKPLKFRGLSTGRIIKPYRLRKRKRPIYTQSVRHEVSKTPFRGRRSGIMQEHEGRQVFSLLGGVTTENYVLPPATHHKKYWYFFRKKGAWHPSEHHPYGDEPDYYQELPRQYTLGF